MTIQRVEQEFGETILWYQKPLVHESRLVWGMRGLMVLAVFSSLRNVWNLMELLSEVWAAADDLKSTVLADPDPELALVRDSAVFFQSVVGFVFLLSVVAFVGLITRYIVLWFQVPKGHPKTYAALRFWAIFLIAAELLVAMMWGFAALEEYEELQVSHAFNPLALVGVGMLVLLALRPYKRFYSTYRIQRLQQEANSPPFAPAAADDGWTAAEETVNPDTEDAPAERGQDWQPVYD